MKKKKLDSQQIKFIINMIGIAVFAVSYLFIYTNYENKTEAAYQEISTMKTTLHNLEEQKSQEAFTLDNTKVLKNQMQEILDGYPISIAKENSFLFVEKIQQELDITLSSINISDAIPIFQTILPQRNEDGTEVELSATPVADGDSLTMQGLEASITMNFETSYQGFKQMVEYIANYPEQTVIDSVSVSYDSSTGNLSGSLVIKRYALTGTGKAYEVPMIGDISIGTDNIFGTEAP